MIIFIQTEEVDPGKGIQWCLPLIVCLFESVNVFEHLAFVFEP